MSQDNATYMRLGIERDSKVSGLHIRHQKSGSAWYLYYRTKDGQERRPKLGSVAVLNTTRARDMAIAILRDVALGKDPKREKNAGRTVQDMHEEYDRLHASIEIKPSTRRQEELYWRKFILPWFGPSKPVTAITRPDIIGFKSELRNTPTQANRILALLSHAFNMAEEWGWRPQQTNPCYKVKRYRESARTRLPANGEVERLFATLYAWQHEQPWFVGMILLMMLTGARRSEIMKARREWCQGDKLVLPDSKTGAKIIPLNSHAQSVVSLIPEVQGNPWLIVGRRTGQHLVSPAKLWGQLCKEAGIDSLNMHDLRRLFASMVVSSGRSLEQAMQLMGHTQAQTTKRYAFLMTQEKLDVMQETGDRIMSIARAKTDHAEGTTTVLLPG